MAGVSYPVVRAYVAERKPRIRAEAGHGPAEVFVPQTHRPGEEAEVDFGEVVVRLAGEQVKCFLFCLRLSPRRSVPGCRSAGSSSCSSHWPIIALRPPRLRRIALARLDLGLALITAGKLDEAASSALNAVRSGRLAPVDAPRIREIAAAVAVVPEARELNEAYAEEDGPHA
jgi:hypothetical protein